MSELVINSLEKIGNRLVCHVTEPNETARSLWVETMPEWSSYLCDDRVDGFFIICLYRAIKEGWNLRSMVPISERLYYQTTTYMLNLYSEIFGKEKINIDVPVTTKKLSVGSAVGTGISCGVDSLYSVYYHSNLLSKNYNVTHLVLLNVGAYHIASEDPSIMFQVETERAESFCQQHGYSFVKIDSNIRDYLPYSYTEYHGIVNGSTVLTLQSLFKVYYSSSSYKIEEFKIDKNDLSHVEIFNLSVLSTDNITFYSTGGEVSRFEKVKALSQWKPSYGTLHVCNSHSKNCSNVECVKCCRTMIELDVIGALGNYRDVFDVEKFENKKNDYLANFWARKALRHDHYAIEMWPDFTKKYRIPLMKKIDAALRFVISRLRIYDMKTIKYMLKMR